MVWVVIVLGLRVHSLLYTVSTQCFWKLKKLEMKTPIEMEVFHIHKSSIK